jgi:hypothetical protein
MIQGFLNQQQLHRVQLAATDENLVFCSNKYIAMGVAFWHFRSRDDEGERCNSYSKGITLEFIQPGLFSQHKTTQIIKVSGKAAAPKPPGKTTGITTTPTTLRCTSDRVATVLTLSSRQQC